MAPRPVLCVSTSALCDRRCPFSSWQLVLLHVVSRHSVQLWNFPVEAAVSGRPFLRQLDSRSQSVLALMYILDNHGPLEAPQEVLPRGCKERASCQTLPLASRPWVLVSGCQSLGSVANRSLHLMRLGARLWQCGACSARLACSSGIDTSARDNAASCVAHTCTCQQLHRGRGLQSAQQHRGGPGRWSPKAPL